MSFVSLRVGWICFLPEIAAPGDALPVVLLTPRREWDYGVASEPLLASAQQGVLRLVIRVERGVVGVSLTTPNYGALLTQEAAVAAGPEERVLDFAFNGVMGPCRILMRTYGEAANAARITLLSLCAGESSDLSPAEAACMLAAQAAAYAPPLTDEIAAWATPQEAIFAPISLGNTCEAKFQIARALQFRRDPAASELGFRLAMLPPCRSEVRFGWELFDWQGTALKTVLTYLETDFAGLFERADLEGGEGGVVLHRRLLTFHEHDFEALLDDPRAKVTDVVIDQGYPAARARFDAMVERFQAILRTPGPYLYVHVCEDIPGDWVVERLVNALRARSQTHRFRLLFVGYEDSDTPWGDYAHAVADKAFRPRAWVKPEGRSWEGSDEAWDAALSPYQLVFPDGSPAEQPRG